MGASGTRVTKRVMTLKSGGKEGAMKREGEGYCLYLEVLPLATTETAHYLRLDKDATPAGPRSSKLSSKVGPRAGRSQDGS